MWTIVILLNLGVLYCAGSSTLPSPINVVFSSINLKNVLHWAPGNGTPNDTYYTVQYLIYGDTVEGKGKRLNWKEVWLCTRIGQTWCDLSNETWDQELEYYARVRAVGRKVSSKWAVTQRRFDPKSETIFGPPLVSVETTDNTAIITLKGPMRYQPDNHAPVVSMETVYPQMTYNLSIYNARRNIVHHFVGSNLYTYSLMDYNTKYCFSAKTRFPIMPVQCNSSEWYCITTPEDPVFAQVQRIVVAIVVPSLCMCALVVVCHFLANYLRGRGQKSPYTLNLISFYPSPLTLPDCENITHITVVQPDHTTCPPFPDRNFGYPVFPPRYSAQGPPIDDEDPAPDYGLVCVAPIISVITGEEDTEERHERKEWGKEEKCKRCTAEDSYDKKEWIVGEGQCTGFYAPQTKPSLAMQSTHICTQTHMPTDTQIHTQAEMRTSAWIGAPSKTQVTKEKEDIELPRLLINKNPQTGFFHIPLNAQTTKDPALRDDMFNEVRVTDEKLNRGIEELSKHEKVALLSAYTSQNMTNGPPFQSELSDFLPDDYGILKRDTAHNRDDDVDDNIYGEEEEEEEGTNFIDWDLETRKLLLPEMSSKQGGVKRLGQGAARIEDSMGEEDREEKKGKLRLENVFVRQPSEEEAEALTGKSGVTESEVEDFVNKWNLVIPVDQ